MEREADSSDDDGGRPGTDVRLCKVENAPGKVLAVTDVVSGLADGAVRVEPAYVVEASQVVRFYVRSTDKAMLKKKKPRTAAVTMENAQKYLEEKNKRLAQEEKEAAARKLVKDNRLKHAVGARVVLDAVTVQRSGARREDLDGIKGDRWGTIKGLEPGLLTPWGARGHMLARVAWDGPEDLATMTAFPIQVTAPRLLGRGATIVRAELRDFVELDSSYYRRENGLPLTRADLLIALNAPLPGAVTEWYEKDQELGGDALSKKKRFQKAFERYNWKIQTTPRGELPIWGFVADKNPSVIVWEAPAFGTSAAKALALLDRLGGIVSTVCKFRDRNQYEVADPRPTAAPTESKGIVGQALGLFGMGGSAKAGQTSGEKKCDDLVKLVRLVRLALASKTLLAGGDATARRSGPSGARTSARRARRCGQSSSTPTTWPTRRRARSSSSCWPRTSSRRARSRARCLPRSCRGCKKQRARTTTPHCWRRKKQPQQRSLASRPTHQPWISLHCRRRSARARRFWPINGKTTNARSGKTPTPRPRRAPSRRRRR